jgi:hypothetical protein
MAVIGGFQTGGGLNVDVGRHFTGKDGKVICGITPLEDHQDILEGKNKKTGHLSCISHAFETVPMQKDSTISIPREVLARKSFSDPALDGSPSTNEICSPEGPEELGNY